MKIESRYMLAIILLLAVLSVKSLLIDGVDDLTAEERQFTQYVFNTIETQEKWALNKTDVLTYKIVKIIKTDESPVSVDLGEGGVVALDGHYTARVRKYIFKILPYGDFSVTIKND